ncbi:MAG: carbon storage regulator [Defluviitaleaceae bacterium]|nr:carbon storage regulator [Defluviitaleaceae bacterium]
MLHLTLSKGEHVMIGDEIKLTYAKNDGKKVATLRIEAPREVIVTRGKVYEDRIATQASEGNREAMQLLEKIIEENATRKKIFNKRRAKRQNIAGRI